MQHDERTHWQPIQLDGGTTAYLDPRLGDPATGIGFPVAGGQPEFDQLSAEYEGGIHAER